MTVVKLSDREGRANIQSGLSPAERRRRIRFVILLPIFLVLLFIVVSFNTDFIPSGSMEPTLEPGDHIVTMRAWIAYPFGQMPERGDIITFRLSKSNQIRDAMNTGETADAATEDNRDNTTGQPLKPEILIKRVIGLPGDKIQIVGDKVYVNGHPLVEGYETIPPDPEQDYPYAVNAPLIVPPDHLFVLGDNRTNSDDGRFWGTLKRSDVLGKYVGKLFHQKVKEDDTQAAGPGGQ